MTRGLGADELERLIEEGEGRRLEFKQGLPRSAKLARTLAAFANTRGGVLIIGVGDRGEIWGAPHPERTAQALREVARESIEPPLELEVRVVALRDRRLVYAAIAKSARGPHAVIGDDDSREHVVRVGASNRRADGPTLRALALGARSSSTLDSVERRILDWLDRVDRRGARANSCATAAAFAREHNLGLQRAKRAFVALERRGLVVGHGKGAARAFARP